MPRAVLAAISAGLLAGCATPADQIAPAYVSPAIYQHLSCDQIQHEVRNVVTLSNVAAQNQTAAAEADQIGMAIGLLVLWPMLLFTGGDGATAAEVAQLRGQMVALEQISAQKGCGIEFATQPG
jgi:hypothetical protein